MYLYANRLLQRLLQLQISADAREGHHCSLHCLHAAQVHMLPTPRVANVMALHWFCPTRWLVFILFRELCQGFSLLWCEKCVSFSAHFKQIFPHMIQWLRRVYCPLKDFFLMYHFTIQSAISVAMVPYICNWSTLSGLTHVLIIRTRSLHPKRQDVSEKVRWNNVLGIRQNTFPWDHVIWQTQGPWAADIYIYIFKF